MSAKTRTNRPNTNSGSLGQFHKSHERMAHLSAPIGYRPNPDFDPRIAVGPFNVAEIPFLVKLGRAGTFNVGRNQAKREKREAAKAVRA